MSRLGKKPVAIPSGVKIDVANDRTITVEGKLGKLTYQHRPEVSIAVEDNEIVVTRGGEDRADRAFHGLTRALLANMVVGVSQGYEKKLEIQGVGYLGAISGDTLQLRVGFANEIQKKIPGDLQVTCPDQTHIVIKGLDKQRVGQFAAEVRAVRKPEPYKGKGIRYEGEQVRRKAGKAAK
ncbi:50S ribosomal protein L6 [Botrimarina mediterranea]|uniref:Large ribosomal subunit protein uL6 n=1 Tax=Botrimarina mediterranea TaxID=2528022 RepID=A0A518KEK9_9BACT|nr:50S ribosomal protein L6 [Botrimarina mediterranea]QDV76228.1 50S ribosomal protein L6 [Botrimarina mediterranea]QDV80826.1 50S ribosomal protein L6 [Planctomycetes bacterium K2D]